MNAESHEATAARSAIDAVSALTLAQQRVLGTLICLAGPGIELDPAIASYLDARREAAGLIHLLAVLAGGYDPDSDRELAAMAKTVNATIQALGRVMGATEAGDVEVQQIIRSLSPADCPVLVAARRCEFAARVSCRAWVAAATGPDAEAVS